MRDELAGWLAAHLTPDVVEAGRHMGDDDEAFEVLRRWNRTLADAGWAAVAWPAAVRRPRRRHRRAAGLARGDGPGRGARAGQRHRRLQHRPGHHGRRHRRAAGAVPPAHAARRRDLVPGHVGARRRLGSGLAAHRAPAATATCSWSTGRRPGTASVGTPTGASSTSAPIPEAPKHKGHQLPPRRHAPARASRSARFGPCPGDLTFSELFFDDVRVPRDALLGPLNEGWRVAMTTLSHERAGVARLHLSLGQRFERLVTDAKGLPGLSDPTIRNRLAIVYQRIACMRWTTTRELERVSRGSRPLAQHGEPDQADVVPRRNRPSPSWPST